MSDTRALAERLYQAFADDDGRTLAELVHPDFTGRVSAGMPLDIGGEITDARQMLRGIWGAIAREFDVTPEPDEYVPVGSDRMIVFGFYRGHARSTGHKFAAAFAHDVTVRDGKLASLVQITDTKLWHDALNGSLEANRPD